jgi:alpha-amylase
VRGDAGSAILRRFALPGLVLAMQLLCQTVVAEPRSVFVQLFEWTWPDVAQECEQVLGPAGFSAVQVSPPNEHVDHRSDKLAIPYAWWARYQPVSFDLVSRSGDEAAFRDMVRRCAEAGVGIYVDAVLNHMADQVGVGINGTTFDRERRQYRDFSDAQFNRFCRIRGEDYRAAADLQENADRAERIRRCQLLDLPDLDNGNLQVWAVHAAYLQGLLDLGVAGFRLDAAKHMFPEHIGTLLDTLDGEFYVFQEVVDTRGEPVGVLDYAARGDVTEFLYSARLGRAFAAGRLADLKTLNEAGGLLPSDAAVVFVDNHDNQRGHGMSAETTHRDGRVYDLANVFMLAWPYGYPKLMSSYEWGGKADSRGPPHDGRGNTLPVYTEGAKDCGGDNWVCEHSRLGTLAMVGFRNRLKAAGAASAAHWWDNGSTQLAFSVSSEDASRGFVAINRDETARLDRKMATGFPAGRYRNLLGEPVTVDGVGMATVRLGPLEALAIERDSLVP